MSGCCCALWRCALLLVLACAARGAAGLVTRVLPRGEECFFVATSERGVDTCQVSWQTQHGRGRSLDIDVDVHDPREMLVFTAIRQPEGHTSFRASRGGRYRVCFSNLFSGDDIKDVAFRVRCEETPPDDHDMQRAPPVEHETREAAEERALGKHIQYHALPLLAQKDALEAMTSDLSVVQLMLLNVMTQQRMFTSTLKAHRDVVTDTNHNVVWWRSMLSGAVVVCAMFQLVYIRYLFEYRKPEDDKKAAAAAAAAKNNGAAATSPPAAAASPVGASAAPAAALPATVSWLSRATSWFRRADVAAPPTTTPTTAKAKKAATAPPKARSSPAPHATGTGSSASESEAIASAIATIAQASEVDVLKALQKPTYGRKP